MEEYCLNEFFDDVSKTIKIYLAIETETDPYEHTKELTYLNPLPIRAIITDLTFAKVQWAMPGVLTDKAKEIIIEKKYKSLLLKSYKIKVDEDYYQGWKVNNKLQYRTEGNYIRAYIYIKKD